MHFLCALAIGTHAMVELFQVLKDHVICFTVVRNITVVYHAHIVQNHGCLDNQASSGVLHPHLTEQATKSVLPNTERLLNYHPSAAVQEVV